MEKIQQTALSMWRNALVAKNAKTQMPELYSEQEIHEISDFIESVFGKYDYFSMKSPLQTYMWTSPLFLLPKNATIAHCVPWESERIIWTHLMN